MQSIKEKGGIQGTVIVRSHPAGTIDRYHALKAEGRLAEAQALIKTGEVKVRQRNIIVWSLNYGYDILIQFLLSAYTGSFAFASTLGIAWGEIGTGNTAPANTNTALTTPTNRAPVSYAADIGFNEAQLQFFFPDAALANETYYEFGSFIGGNPGGLFICKMAVNWGSEIALAKANFKPLDKDELLSLVPGLQVIDHHERPVRDRGVVEFVGRKQG